MEIKQLKGSKYTFSLLGFEYRENKRTQCSTNLCDANIL